MVVRRGNLERDTNDAELLVYRISEVWKDQKGKQVALFSSAINRPAIALVEWVDDERVRFVGTQSPDVSQVYEANAVTGKVTQLTHATVSFDWVTSTPHPGMFL